MANETERDAYDAWKVDQPWYIVSAGDKDDTEYGTTHRLMNIAAWTAWEAAAKRAAITAPTQPTERSAELEAVQRDAQRYRFARLGSMTAMVIETNGEILNAGHRYMPHELAMEWAEKIDAAVDAAIAAAPQKGEAA